ncbi:MAG: DUF1549 domain-containing protein, partial [Planctomycetaceae bacterium]|nr:DUF1549 domain-containing protein [Planctomycetaceae bacterium]
MSRRTPQLAVLFAVCFCILPEVPAAPPHDASSTAALTILANRCFLCHGPDEGTREGDLRLDTADDATRERDGKFAVKPGNPEASEILSRIRSTDPDLVMPPPDSKIPRLTDSEVAAVRLWIEDGASYLRHWAFVPPQRPAVPEMKHADRVRNPIDAFVLRRLEQEGIAPSPQADPVTLLRRLNLDLIGLPPTVAELDAYLAEANGDANAAYEKQVARLLDSQHYGERWGRIWL